MLNVCSSIRTRPSTISCPHHILPRTHTHSMHPNNFSKNWKELKIKRLDKSQNNAMHFVAIIFLPLFVQSFSLFAVPAISDFIFTIHLNVLLQQDVHCPLKILPLQIVLIVRYYMYIFFNYMVDRISHSNFTVYHIWFETCVSYTIRICFNFILIF